MRCYLFLFSFLRGPGFLAFCVLHGVFGECCDDRCKKSGTQDCRAKEFLTGKGSTLLLVW